MKIFVGGVLMRAAVGLGKVPQFKKVEVLDLKNDRRFNESWLEQLVCDDPGILGLGKVKVLSKQKRTKDGIGRLDLVLESEDKITRFVVELMLGPLDESHIVRTIHYWLDEENDKAKGVECRAVLIGERIVDSRFGEVAKFLTTTRMPLVVKEVAGLQVGNAMTLHFTTIFRSDDLEASANEESTAPVDAGYWLKKSKQTVEVARAVVELLRKVDPSVSINPRKNFIGIYVGNRPILSLVSFGPFRDKVRFRIRVEDASPWRKRLAKAGLQVLQTDRDDNKVRLVVTRKEISRNERMLRELCRDGYDFWSGDLRRTKS